MYLGVCSRAEWISCACVNCENVILCIKCANILYIENIHNNRNICFIIKWRQLPHFLLSLSLSLYSSCHSVKTVASYSCDQYALYLILSISCVIPTAFLFIFPSIPSSAACTLIYLIYNGDNECGGDPLLGIYSFSKSRNRKISLPAAAKSPCNDSSRSRNRLMSRWHV